MAAQRPEAYPPSHQKPALCRAGAGAELQCVPGTREGPKQPLHSGFCLKVSRAAEPPALAWRWGAGREEAFGNPCGVPHTLQAFLSCHWAAKCGVCPCHGPFSLYFVLLGGKARKAGSLSGTRGLMGPPKGLPNAPLSHPAARGGRKSKGRTHTRGSRRTR